MDSVVAISLQGLQLTPVFHKILNSGASGLDTSSFLESKPRNKSSKLWVNIIPSNSSGTSQASKVIDVYWVTIKIKFYYFWLTCPLHTALAKIIPVFLGDHWYGLLVTTGRNREWTFHSVTANYPSVITFIYISFIFSFLLIHYVEGWLIL